MNAGPACWDASGRETLTERHVQAVWYDRDFRPRNLVTRRGVPVFVVHPGEWNLGKGPDFLGAVLEIGPERRRLRGDVEVHLSPSDWTQHGHGGDPAYANVIAHVTWGCGPDPATLPTGAVTIWLGRFLAGTPAFSPEQIDLGAYPLARLPCGERPCARRLRNNHPLAEEVLDAAGARRLEAKAVRLRRLLASPDADPRQTFYAEVMSALGYRRNAAAFRAIASAVPYASVEAEPEIASSAFRAAAPFAGVVRGRVRPRNAPGLRLAAAARLFTERPVFALAESVSFDPPDLKAMVELLSRDHLMGPGRAAAILANVVVPWALALGRLPRAPAWLPPEDLSEPVRLTANRMFGRDHSPRAWYAANGLHIQGLIHIHRAWCLNLHPDCDACRVAVPTAATDPFCGERAK